MKGVLLSLFILIISLECRLFAQNPNAQSNSIHQEQLEYYNNLGISAEEYELQNQIMPVPSTPRNLNCTLNKMVFGWHPYWSNGLETNYNWNLLSDLSYFAYEVDPNTGNAYNTHGWTTASVVTTALANNVRVNLCATMFSGHATFFASSTSQQTLISNLISLVQQRNAHGVNIDFEAVPSTESANLTSFMINLSNQVHAAIPGSQVSIALPAVDWSGTFNVAAMNGYVDVFAIMGYDYYWSGSSQAGPTDPLYSHTATYDQNISKSINYYLNQGVTPSKLILGLPYYGREWETQTNTVPSNTTGNFNSSRTYKVVRDNVSGNYSTPNFYLRSMTNYYVFQVSGNWRQCFINDAFTLGKRCDMVNQRGIGGIGIWALGYDHGYSDLWNKLEAKFTNCANVACSDTIYDMGGPLGNYYNNEIYTYTIAPTNSYSVSLAFSSFNTEANYDSLWIYNGSSITAPLIGSYTGTSSPGTINATGNALTLRYKSDGNTVSSGWQGIWSCNVDTIPPTSVITGVNNWETQSFNTTFNDNDTGGSGIDRRFYQVIDYSGTEWRANSNRGFFSDNFDSTVHPDWTTHQGTWSINGGYLYQSDEANGNTNISAALTQNLSNSYLYHWSGKIDGAGTNKRAGFHFFCDNPSLPNRGNSYFVWFRADQNQLQIYKVINDVFGSPVHSIPIVINAGQWYDHKVIFDRISGKMNVYIDGILVTSWTDSAPHSNGSHISFRSGNAAYSVNNLKVYRSRAANVLVNVGMGTNDDIRYQNLNSATPSGRIKSIIKDNAGNLSVIASQNINVDWTTPSDVTFVNDGLASDIDTTYNNTQLSANWDISTDPNSGLVKYLYAIGTSPGDSDIVSWTDNGLTTVITHLGLALSYGQLYYYTIRAENGAGLVSNAVVSNGQLLDAGTGVDEESFILNISAFPNPFNESVVVSYNLTNNQLLEIKLTDMFGKEVMVMPKQNQLAGEHSMLLDAKSLSLSSGVYLLEFNSSEHKKAIRLLVY